MVADYLTGLVVAWMGKSPKSETGGPSSRIGFQGILKKLLMIGLVFAAAQVDLAMGSGTFIVRDAAVWFYLANEGLSILENMTLAGVPFPQRIKDLLGQIKDQNDSGSDSDKTE
jgi:toxin secretion/phage lysis holin